MNRNTWLIIITLVITAMAVSCSYTRTTYEKIDDWEYDSEKMYDQEGAAGFSAPVQSARITNAPMAMEECCEDGIGFAVGGAMDINNFRDNIENDYLPLPTDITPEGIFYDYFFETGQTEPCEKLFCPSYSTAISRDPFSGEKVYYLSVGLNSGLKESDFSRKKLNLIIVLDISGSMSSGFNRYYYDQFGNEVEIEDSEDLDKTKMQIANEAIVDLLDHLDEDDRFGMVLYDDRAYLAKPMRLVKATDMENIKQHILEITPQGGTNMAAGMEMGTELYEELLNVDQSEYENRIIFLTDAMPNTGETSEQGLFGMMQNNADQGIYTTFIGIGLDFNTELIEAITKIKGANYYSVRTPQEFKERMDEGFDFMVTPLVFNLELVLQAEGYDIEKVYGSPEADEATGEIMSVNTLFPSKRVEGETRGGLVLLKLTKTSSDGSIELRVSYEDREGNVENVVDEVDFSDADQDYYDNSGIRKGILLSRYVDLVKNWLMDERLKNEYMEDQPLVTREDGIIVPPPFDIELGRWERQSMPLTVSSHYQELFEDFYDYFQVEMEALGDTTLQQELDILDKLIKL
ncbi:MAG: vWA domain-containing protein [bacterium]